MRKGYLSDTAASESQGKALTTHQCKQVLGQSPCGERLLSCAFTPLGWAELVVHLRQAELTPDRAPPADGTLLPLCETFQHTLTVLPPLPPCPCAASAMSELCWAPQTPSAESGTAARGWCHVGQPCPEWECHWMENPLHLFTFSLPVLPPLWFS